MDQLGAALQIVLQGIEQAVDMFDRLGAALRGEAGRLVEHDRLRIAVNDHFACKGDFIVAERRPLALDRGIDPDWLGGGHADRLARDDMVAGLGARAIDAQLPGARPFRDGGVAGVGQVPLEPAIEPDAVVIHADIELADIGGCLGGAVAHAATRTLVRPTNTARIDPITDTST
ncbi:hypothetical protein D9M73_111370 [compost metagenome]